MAILDFFKKQEKRETAVTVDTTLESLLLGTTVMTKEDALTVPALAACVEFISSAVASIPIKLFEDTSNGVNEIKNDYRLKLLNDETGDLLDGYQWKKAMVTDFLLCGAGYSFVNWNMLNIDSINYVDERNVSVVNNADVIFKKADIFVQGKPYMEYQFLRITRNSLDGVTGTGVLQENPKILEIMYNSMALENTTSKTGNKKGFLQSKTKLATDTIAALKAAWKSLYSTNAESVVVLNEGIEFKEASNTSVEMQMNENKKTNSAEVCKLFNISPKIFEGGATVEEYKNSIKMGVLPVLVAFKTALNKFLLLETEKATKYFEFDTDELLKSDIETRFKAYEIGVKNGFMQLDEVRYKEDLKPFGLDFIKLGLQDVLYYPETGEVYTPNTDKSTNANGKGVKTDESGNQSEPSDN